MILILVLSVKWYISSWLIEEHDCDYEMLVETLLLWVIAVKGENFPSLLSANATLAIVIDKEYLASDKIHNEIKEAVENNLLDFSRKNLKHGGVKVQFFPWIAINVKREADCPRLPTHQAVTVPIISNGEEMPQLLLDLRSAKTYNWKSAIILYDDTLSRDQVARIVNSLTLESSSLRQNSSSAVSLWKLDSDLLPNALKSSLKQIFGVIRERKLGNNFLAMVSYDIVEVIMEYAKMLELVNTKTQWLYVISDTNRSNSDVDRFKQLLFEGDNVAFIFNNTEKIKETAFENQFEDKIKCHTKEILNAFTLALDEAIVLEYEAASHVSDEEWEAIRPSKSERRDSLLKGVKTNLLKNGTCDNATSWILKTGDTWGREFQQNMSNSDIINVGNWRLSDGPSLQDELFPHIAHKFRKRNLHLNPPWQIIKANDSEDTNAYRGLLFDIIQELSKRLNFTYTIDVVKLENNAKTNMSYLASESFLDHVTTFLPETIVEMIRNKSVAFGACVFTITEESKQFINFTRPISTQTYSFLVARPRELSRALLFLAPFTGDTWLCLSVAIVSMGPILYLVHRYSPVYEYKGITRKGGLTSIQNCIWYMYGALLQQGGMHLPYADSARILVGAWWLVVLVMATTYCGNLVAFLTFPKIDIPITTIDDLIALKETVTWSMEKGSLLETELRTTTQPTFRTLYEGKLNVLKSEDLVKKIEDGKHVFIDWKIRLQYIMKHQYLETGRCDLSLGLDEFFDEQLAMIVSQDSPYLEILNDEIKKLHQVGLIEKWLKGYLPEKDRCWKNRHIIEVNNHTVNMDDMQGSFFVLFLGFTLSLLIILSEKLLHKYLLKKKKKKIIEPFTS